MKRRSTKDILADVMDARQSIANGNEAMNRVEANANGGCPGWSVAATYCIILYPEEVFLIEDVKEWAYKVGLQRPHKHQAWGGPTQRLSRAGIISKAGQGRRKHKDHHGDLTNQWKKVLTGNEFHGEKLDLPPHGLGTNHNFKKGYDPY